MVWYDVLERYFACIYSPRPPAESVTELNKLVTAAPADAQLFLLRSRQVREGAAHGWTEVRI